MSPIFLQELDVDFLHAQFAHHPPTIWALLAAAVVAGGVVRGLTGFGAALLMAPLFSLVMSARDTLCLITVLNVLPLSPRSMRLAWQEMDASVVRPLSLAAVVGLVPGIWLTTQMPGAVFGPLVGFGVMLSALLLMTGARLPDIRSVRASAAIGSVSGVLTGFSGVGGPPAILYLMGIESNPYRARANFVIFFALLYPVSCAFLVLSGLMPHSILLAGALLFPLFHIGGGLGVRLYRNIGRRLLRRLVLMLLLIAGAVAMLPFLRDPAGFIKTISVHG